MDRRGFLAGAGAAGLTATFGGVSIDLALAQGLRKETFMYPAGVTILSAYVISGLEIGAFRDEGIDLSLQTGPGTAASLAQVASGGTMFGQSAPIGTAPAIADQGASLITVGQVSYPGYFEIASLPGKPLLHPRDMQGKTIGILSKGGSTELLLDAMSISQGLDPTKVNRVITGLSTAGVAFLERGQVDGFFVFYETKVSLEHQGVKLAYMPSDDWVTLPGDAMIVSPDTIKKPGGEETLVRYLRAAARATAFARDPANAEKVLDYFAKHNPVQGGDRARNMAILKVVQRLMTPPAGVPATHCALDQWEKGIRNLESMGVIKQKGLPLDRYVTNRYAEMAAKA